MIVKIKTSVQKKINFTLNIAAAERAIRIELANQKSERFRTQGESDGQRWLPSRWISEGGLLKRLGNQFVFSSAIRQNGFTVEYGVSGKDAKIANIHQHGTKIGKDIVPVRAKALFLPLRGIARRSVLVGGIRVGQSGNRMGTQPKPTKLKVDRDFLLLSRIKATAEKGGRAIPRRPIAVLTNDQIIRLKNAMINALLR